MNNYILIVPDVHGRQFWRDVQDHVEDFAHIVFLGDYLDPYSYENITMDDALQEFTEILKLKQQHFDKVTLLLGNHDLHYYWTEMECSRRSRSYLNLLHKFFILYTDMFSLGYEVKTESKTYLFTHAGILQGWLDANNIHYSLDSFNSLLDGYNWELFDQIGPSRCGFHQYGSPVWADVHEHKANPPLPGIYQIFGHTQQESDPVITEDYACLDCRRMFALNIETREIII